MPWPGLTQMADLQKTFVGRRASPRSPSWAAGGWTEPAAVDAFTRFSERFDLPVATSFRRAALCSTTCHGRTTPARSASAPNPALLARAHRSGRPACCWSAAAWARSAVASLHAVRRYRCRAQRCWCMFIPACGARLGRVYASGTRRSTPRRRSAFCGLASKAVQPPHCDPPGPALAAAAHAEYRVWTDEAPARGAGARRCSMAPPSCWLRDRAAAGRDRHQRRRQFRDRCRGASFGFRRLRRPACAELRARWAMACPQRSAPSGSSATRMVVCLRGRWLIS